jgi:hypothetical protein
MGKNIDLNQLPTEVKILIVNAQTLVDKTKAGVKEKRTEVDLTGKFQLKDDCKAIEKLIKKIQSGKADEKIFRDLNLAVIRLQTTAGALLKIEV